MELKLVRKEFTDQCTIGELTVDGKFECFTLEDCCRDQKIHSKTAIPAGRYEVTINFSNRFKKQLPLLMNVPDFLGVRIHSGNTAADTEGCILVGTSKGKGFVGNSRTAFNALFEKMRVANRSEKIFIEIEGKRP